MSVSSSQAEFEDTCKDVQKLRDEVYNLTVELNNTKHLYEEKVRNKLVSTSMNILVFWQNLHSASDHKLNDS